MTYRRIRLSGQRPQRRFDGFNERAAAPPGDDVGLKAEWGGNAERLVEAIGAAKFQAWFSGSAFDAGPPVTIKVEKPFAAEWIRNHYSADLRRLFGDVRVEIGK